MPRYPTRDRCLPSAVTAPPSRSPHSPASRWSSRHAARRRALGATGVAPSATAAPTSRRRPSPTRRPTVAPATPAATPAASGSGDRPDLAAVRVATDVVVDGLALAAVGRPRPRRQRPAGRRGAGRPDPDRRATASCCRSPISTSPTGSRAAASAACSGVAFPPGFGDRRTRLSRPLLGPGGRHDHRRLRRAGRAARRSTRPAGASCSPSRSRTPTTTAAGSGSTRPGCC